MKVSNQKSGDNSLNLQAGGNITVQNGTVALYSIEEVSRQLLSSVFGELPDEAKQQITKNQKSYFQALAENLGKIVKQNDELKKIVGSPDFQFISKTAAISASRSPSIELHKNLASLVFQRINNDNEDLKRIVYDEAIATINKLTVDQLKIITLCYLARYTTYGGVISWDAFTKYLNTYIKPFTDFKNTNAEFQHIEYAGCGSIGIGSSSILETYKRQYSFLFLNLVEKAEIDDLDLSEEVKKELLRLDTIEDKYFIWIKNRDELEKYLKEKKIEEVKLTQFTSLYDRNIKNSEEVKKKLEEDTEIGKELLALWEKSNVSRLSLTSVGIAIAASYFEQTVGEKINIDIWIN